jgi:hypothetical protein
VKTLAQRGEHTPMLRVLLGNSQPEHLGVELCTTGESDRLSRECGIDVGELVSEGETAPTRVGRRE